MADADVFRLVKLREAYKVQGAREAGRDEGRLEVSLELLEQPGSIYLQSCFYRPFKRSRGGW
jgi:hypothetical protein